jgi:hypothetical protein
VKLTTDFLAINPLNAELNPIFHLLALVGAHHILHVSRIRVKSVCSWISTPQSACFLLAWWSIKHWNNFELYTPECRDDQWEMYWNSVDESDHRLIWDYYRISELTDENPLRTSVGLPVSGKMFGTETSKVWNITLTYSTVTFGGDKEHVDEEV